MKGKLYIFLVFAAMLIAVTSCDKRDCNGSLDGMWQMTEWRDKDNVVKATKDDMIYYSFQLQMAGFRRSVGGRFDILTTMLEVSPEKIRIYDPAIYAGDKHDEIQPMSVLSVFGVPEDGIFWIQKLTGSTMVLKTNNQELLTFRKF